MITHYPRVGVYSNNPEIYYYIYIYIEYIYIYYIIYHDTGLGDSDLQWRASKVDQINI